MGDPISEISSGGPGNLPPETSPVNGPVGIDGESDSALPGGFKIFVGGVPAMYEMVRRDFLSRGDDPLGIKDIVTISYRGVIFRDIFFLFDEIKHSLVLTREDPDSCYPVTTVVLSDIRRDKPDGGYYGLEKTEKLLGALKSQGYDGVIQDVRGYRSIVFEKDGHSTSVEIGYTDREAFDKSVAETHGDVVKAKLDRVSAFKNNWTVRITTGSDDGDKAIGQPRRQPKYPGELNLDGLESRLGTHAKATSALLDALYEAEGLPVPNCTPEFSPPV